MLRLSDYLKYEIPAHRKIGADRQSNGKYSIANIPIDLFGFGADEMPQKQKFIRKEWARVKANMDKLPQFWFLILGLLMVILAFGTTAKDVINQLFGIS